jgi:TonB family protein
MELSLSSQQRAIADRQFRKILPIGLCCSALVHTAAFATVNYLAQPDLDDLEITAIERVELDPEPTPTPTPAVKPIATPKPQPVKITKSAPVPKPQPVKIAKPKPIPTPSIAPVVKITKSAVAVKPLADFTEPPVKKAIAPTFKPAPAPKPVTPPAFPDRLFEQPTPQPPAAKATVKSPQKIVRKSAPKQTPLVTQPLEQPAPIKDDLPSTPPGNTPKVAKSTEDRSPTTTNQTNLATAKSPQIFDNPAPAASNPAPEEDFGSGVPGNNKPIASNNNPAPASSNNQTGLANNSSQGKRSVNFDAASGSNTSNPSDDIGSVAPGNNKRIAISPSNSSPSNANSTGLGGKNPGNGAISKNFGSSGTGDGSGTSGDNIGGTPGNIATGSNRQLSIQCLRNCEIRYPETIQDNETGKDKILVRVSIDTTGKVTNAEIARSSGNQNLDRAALDGIKQMQLTPMGKPLTFKVKVTTLTNG